MHAGGRAGDHRLEPGAPGRGLAVRRGAREGESENRGERDGRRLPESRFEPGGHAGSNLITTTVTNVNTATDLQKSCAGTAADANVFEYSQVGKPCRSRTQPCSWWTTMPRFERHSQAWSG